MRRSVERQVEGLVTKALGDRAWVVRVFPRAPAELTGLQGLGGGLQQQDILVAAEMKLEVRLLMKL